MFHGILDWKAETFTFLECMVKNFAEYKAGFSSKGDTYQRTLKHMRKLFLQTFFQERAGSA